MTTKPTIIDFVEKYTREFASHVFLREKPADRWTETTFEQTRLESYRVAAGLMALGIEKGDKVSLLSAAGGGGAGGAVVFTPVV